MLPDAADGLGPRAADPWRSHSARILRITPEVPGVRTYDLEFTDPRVRAAYRFAAGQFNMLYLPGIGEAAISISSDAATPALLAHTVRAVGNVTDALARLEPGDEILLRGPFGRPWPAERLRGRHVVVVGGGLGLASQRTAIYEFARHRDCYAGVTVLHGAKLPAGLFYTAEYAAWRAVGIDVRPVVDEGGPDARSGERGRDLLRARPDDERRGSGRGRGRDRRPRCVRVARAKHGLCGAALRPLPVRAPLCLPGRPGLRL
jgi:NAD(P)H-flavin reductase